MCVLCEFCLLPASVKHQHLREGQSAKKRSEGVKELVVSRAAE